MGAIQPWHLLLVVLAVVVLFGPGKLPALAKSFGQSIREFRTSVKDEDEEKPTDQAPTDQP